MSARVYVPLTLDLLREAYAAGALPSGTERVVAENADEEAEYLALMTAADLSAAMPGVAGRRVVAVAETGDPDAGIPLSEVVAVHADPAPFTDPDEDLAWYAVQELGDLLGRL